MYKLEIDPSETLHTKFGTAKLDEDYYRITSTKEDNHNKYLHRLIFENFYGEIPQNCSIHHKDNNKVNNCIMNLKLMTVSEHQKIHHINKPLPSKTRKKISETLKGHTYNNTTGYFRVTTQKCKRCKQGFMYRYANQYKDKDGKYVIDAIARVDLKELEKAVKEKGWEWKKLNGDT